MRFTLTALFAFVTLLTAEPVVDCPCDHADRASLKPRVCSLCGTAETHKSEVYFLKDINPHKPNRYLALPKAHTSGFQSTADLDDDARAGFWSAAIARAEELFPGRWGIAQNSHFFRTQCHAHLHIGPLNPEVGDAPEGTEGVVYSSPSEFPNVSPDQGSWLHPKDGKYCFHLDRDLAEIVLVR